MSFRQLVQQVGPGECIGDSLITFNSNFSALDAALFDIPKVTNGLGTSISREVTEQSNGIISISTKNSFAWNTKFDSTQVAYPTTIGLRDGTTVGVTTFPYVSSFTDQKPTCTFSTIALTDKVPEVTLCWTASGSDNLTVYALNSALSASDFKGLTWFDDTVNSVFKDGNLLYVGGSFIRVGENISRKFCILDLLSGSSDPVLYTSGTFSSNPFTDKGDLGPIGSVDTIDASEDFLVVGGSFQGGFKGRGLAILNKNTGEVYPFYVNGNVRVVKIKGNSLFVGGAFDYINYGPRSASVVSGLRVMTEGFCKIDLTMMLLNPYDAIQSMSFVFSGPAEVNSLAVYGSNIFVGGLFVIKNRENIICQNLCAIDSNGTRLAYWKPILNGPVYTLIVNDTTTDGGKPYLYVGGLFTRCFTDSEFNFNPRDNKQQTEYHNAVSFKILTDSINVIPSWKPKFNGAVTNFAFLDQDTNTDVYCYGKFTSVNEENRSYLAAVKKSSYSSDSSTGELLLWRPYLQSGPSLINNAFINYDSTNINVNTGINTNTLIVGGNFSAVNGIRRYNLARISNVDGSGIASNTLLSSIAWDFNCNVVSPGTSLSFDSTQTIRLTSYPTTYGNVNFTTFAINEAQFKGITEGQLLRFLVRRQGTCSDLNLLNSHTDSFKGPVNVIGWKLDFN